jgi:hypothetical protein
VQTVRQHLVKKATLRGKLELSGTVSPFEVELTTCNLYHMNRRVNGLMSVLDRQHEPVTLQFAEVQEKHLFRHFDAVKEPRKAVMVTIEESGKFTDELRLTCVLDLSGDTIVGKGASDVFVGESKLAWQDTFGPITGVLSVEYETPHNPDDDELE